MIVAFKITQCQEYLCFLIIAGIPMIEVNHNGQILTVDAKTLQQLQVFFFLPFITFTCTGT